MRSPEESKEVRSSRKVLRDGRADHRGKRMTAICNFSKETFADRNNQKTNANLTERYSKESRI